jgi:hypothetical protein
MCFVVTMIKRIYKDLCIDEIFIVHSFHPFDMNDRALHTRIAS